MKRWIKKKSAACNAGVKWKSNIENVSNSLILCDNHGSFTLYFKKIFQRSHFESVTLFLLTKFLDDEEKILLR